MTNIPQPTLPVEGVFTDAEQNFITESPPGLFPPNQDSNFGLKRKIFCDQLQIAINQLDQIFTERFVMTSTTYLDEWEKLVGLPQNPSAKTDQDRRNVIEARLRGGPFTRPMRRGIVETFITAVAFGQAIQLVPEGVPFPAGGIPIYGEGGAVETLYRVYEDRQRFRYKVKIASASSPDTLAMQRELEHFTPAGITVVIDVTDASPLDYEWDTYETEPQALWRLDETGGTNASDSYVRGLTGAYTGSYVLNSSALLTGDGTRKGVKLTGGYITIPDNAALDPGDTFAFSAWIKRDVIDANNQYLISKGTGSYGVRINGSDGKIILSKVGTGDIAASTGIITDGNVHYVVAQKSGGTVEIWIDGVEGHGAITNQTIVANSIAVNIGREVTGANLPFLGWISYAGLYNRLLTATEINRRYHTGLDQLSEPGLR